MNKTLVKYEYLYLTCHEDIHFKTLVEKILILNIKYKISKSVCYFLLNVMLIIIYSKVEIYKSFNLCINLLESFNNVNENLKQEFCENLNSFNISSIKLIDDKNINNAINETVRFFCFFYNNQNLKLSIQLIHEVIFNIINLDKIINPNNVCIIYVIFMREINNTFENNKLKNSDYYMKVIEICNLSVKLINDWLTE